MRSPPGTISVPPRKPAEPPSAQPGRTRTWASSALRRARSKLACAWAARSRACSALAHRPAEFRAFFDYHDALMESNEGLSKAEREMIVVATSGANDCLYCVVAHGAILRIRAKDPLIADQVAVNPNMADLSERQQAIVDFALLVAEDSASITDDDLDDMRELGFSDDEIWDIGAITALFALSNRYANFAGITPNAEFYGMAR